MIRVTEHIARKPCICKHRDWEHVIQPGEQYRQLVAVGESDAGAAE